MRRVRAVSAALALLLAACGGGSAGPTLAPNLDAILPASVAAMTGVDTVHFTLERGGTPVYIFSNIEFVDAEGDYLAPDRAAAIARVKAETITVQIGAIAIAGETWTTNVITGDWEPATEDLSIDPALLFDSDVGLPELLRTDLQDVELVGLEEGDDGSRYHLRGRGPADRIEVITFGLVRNQDVDIDLWIDPVTGEVLEASFTTLYNGEVATWRLTFSDYGAEVEIPIPAEIDG
jgi:lipoprotein LprG